MTTDSNQCGNDAAKKPLDKDNLISDKELFKIAKKTRDFEIQMFWQRTNYFLLLNSAIGAAFLYFLARLLSGDNDITIGTAFVMAVLCFIGAFVCFAWMQIGFGSKFWQSHWEQILVELQPKVGLKGDMDIFSDKLSKKRVKDSLKTDSCYNSWVLEKPSVSRWMHRTARFFFIVWTNAFICSVFILIYKVCIIYHHAC